MTGPLPRVGDPLAGRPRGPAAPEPFGGADPFRPDPFRPDPYRPDPYRVPPRDPDDTGEILDDSWDGHWGDRDDDPGPDHDDVRTDVRTDVRDDRRVARLGPDAWETRPMGDHPPRLPAVTPPPAPARRRRVATAGAVLALAVALVGLVVGLTRGGGTETASADVVDAWGHRFAVPTGWVRSGGDDAARRLVLRRPEAPRGVDLIAVQTGVLPRDLATDPERARARIADQYEQARAAGDPVSGLELRASVGGRDVTRYRQQVAPGVRLDWIVLLSGGDQVSVGCRHADDGGAVATLPQACEDVVGSLDATAE